MSKPITSLPPGSGFYKVAMLNSNCRNPHDQRVLDNIREITFQKVHAIALRCLDCMRTTADSECWTFYTQEELEAHIRAHHNLGGAR